MTTNTYKLNVKIGSHEFNSEGPEDAVKEAFAIWKELIGAVPITTNKPSLPNSNGNGIPPTPADISSVDSQRLNSLFFYDTNNDLISVKFLPRGTDRDRDILLLILFGYKAIKGQNEVKGTKVVPAMKQSGARVSRIDRLAAKYIERGLINKGGIGKAGIYSLTNTGVTKAIELVNELVGS